MIVKKICHGSWWSWWMQDESGRKHLHRYYGPANFDLWYLVGRGKNGLIK